MSDKPQMTTIDLDMITGRKARGYVADEAVAFLDRMADTLDRWAEESRSGGW